MSDLDAILEAFSGRAERVEDLRGDHAYRAEREVAHALIGRLREQGFNYLDFLTAVDNYLDEPRFEVVYRLRSLEENVDVRVNVPVPGDDPEVDTITDLFPAADWMEREV
ncbi:MAG: NADH-quinone oxidoreductase subunit C, partial [Planctomycetota bacterium]